MNYAQDDILRSLRRFVAEALGSPPWRVRAERQNVSDDERPAAVVEAASPVTTGPRYRVSIPQGPVEKIQAFSIMCYPVIEATAAESRLMATSVSDLLDRAFTLGLVDDQGVNIGGPFRLPIFDWAGVPVKGATRGATPVEPYGFAWVDSLSARPLQDPLDILRWTAVCDLRLSWEQAGRELPAAPIATRMPGSFTP